MASFRKRPAALAQPRCCDSVAPPPRAFMRPRIVERRPHVPLQQEPADCGIRVLEALTALVGRPIAATRFSAQFGLTTKGIPISQMRAMLRAFGFDADVVAIDPCRADQVRTPAAALWDGNHFVALGRTTSRGCDVFDPTRGWHVLSWREIGEHMTGLVIEVTQVPDIAPCVRAQEPSVSSWMNSLPIVKSLLLLALAAYVPFVGFFVPAFFGLAFIHYLLDALAAARRLTAPMAPMATKNWTGRNAPP